MAVTRAEMSLADRKAFSRWLDRAGQLFEFSGQAPAPSKDFCQVIVASNQVIYRWWKISHRTAETQRLNPGEVRESFDDFIHDDRTQTMMMVAFGQNMVDYVINLCHGHVDYLQRIPKNILLKILSYLELEDIARIATLNKGLHKMCQDNDLWRIFFAQGAVITEDLVSLAKGQGWKKLYFSNKLEIQMQLRRRRETDSVQNQPTSFLTQPVRAVAKPNPDS